jgi:hypothetical protein
MIDVISICFKFATDGELGKLGELFVADIERIDIKI